MLKAKQKLLIWPEVRTRGETVVQNYGVETLKRWNAIIIIIITLCNTEKYKNQAGMNFTPPPLSQQDATRRIDWTQWLNGNLLLLLLLINGVASLTGEFACGVVVIWLGRSVVGRLLQQHSTGQCQPTSGLRRTDNAK